MDLRLFILFGITLFGYNFQFSHGQTCSTIRNCTLCSGTTCLQCADGYAQTFDSTGCCSKGCYTDDQGFHLCDSDTGACTYEDCLTGFWGTNCVPCPDLIQNCDVCSVRQNTQILECVVCGTGFNKTTSWTSCCPPGCDSCVGDDGTSCTSCKSSFYLYNNKCDKCGNNCILPADGSARCDPVTGACYLGCLTGWHGAKCNVSCNLNNCATCTYNEAAGNLTCADCNAGYYGPYCSVCNVNCNPASNGSLDICMQDGTCTYGCQPGWRGNLCNMRCDAASNLGNCEQCDRYAFTCTKCKDGYWGNQCQYTCNSNCVKIPGQNTCNITGGSCDNGCMSGYYKSDCSGTCPHCGHDVCDRNTGNCLDMICDPGYYGANCNFTCPSNCKQNPTTLQPYCDFSYGNCTYGCVDGSYGPYCQLGCSVNCAASPTGTETGPLCRQADGACLYQCKAGYYQPQCNTACVSQCVDNTCDITKGTCLECEKTNPGYLCPTGTCTQGKYGQMCQVNCPANCQLTCGRYNGICVACKAGYYGGTCDKVCGQCSSGTCDKDSGVCTSNCLPGYWGSYCNQTCSHTGCRTCLQANGVCETCKTGYYGTDCNGNCSQFCSKNANGLISCDMVSGNCDEGSCQAGYWNTPCDRTCSATCLVDGNGHRICAYSNGNCSLGCVNTYYGVQCTLNCSTRCLSRLCDQNGACAVGCITGAYGNQCELACRQTCNDGTCDRITGECEECKKPVDRQTALCRTAACQPVTTWGLTCQNSCPTNCVNGTCSRDVGTCSSCKAGFYGEFCNKTCPNCLNDRCFQSDGACVSGCKNGWYTLQCMTSCRHTGCLNCDRTSGDCIACKTGLWGTNCSQACSRTCAEVSGVITCNRFSGNCDAGACKAGYYTSNCNSSCSQYCSNVACDIDAGTCSPCINGWYGQRCEGQCSAKCKNSNCEVNEDQCREGCTEGYWGSRCEYNCNVNCANKACHMDTAECLYGCTANLYYGLTCSEPCGGHCLDSVCNRTGYCLKGCAIGWYGDKCQYQCSDVSKCNDGSCSRLQGQCDDCSAATPGPNCPTADCPSGKQGNLCEMNCTSTNCLYNQCGRYTDICNGCPVTYYGNQCSQRCLHCRPGTGCDQGTGECVEGCADGWYTPTCNTQCSSLCTSCERQTGDCITCAAGRWGSACSSNCSKNCKNSETGANLIYCDKQTGACSEGACKVGYWASDCTQGCSQNCKTDANNNRMCAYLDGACQNGCVDTYYGTKCDAICSARCKDKLCINFANTCVISCADGFYGATCSGVCSSFCAGDGKCNTTSGNCLSGCIDGYYGTRCDNGCKNTCVDNKCDSNGGCPDCSLDPVGPNCRVQVCTAGYYGPTCESRCPGQYCLNNQCHRNNGTCDNGCLSGYYGAYCTEVCQCDTAGTDTCEQAKGTCVCKTGRHGTLCDQSCSSGCVGLVCARDGTCTNGCVSGRYGATCNQNCTNCLDQQCYASTGYCIGKCMDGFYGLQCKQTCADECKTCDQTTGACLTCKNSYFSPSTACNRVCSSNCVQQGTARTCDQTTGSCLYGCKTGYYGLNCSNTCGFCDSCDPNTGVCASCQDGWWGSMCKTACNVNCAIGSTNTRNCRQLDGYCSNGCAAGFYGNLCNTACPGLNCLDSVCDRLTGKCPSCKAFYYGENCLSQCGNCTNGQCLQANGYCTGTCPAGKYGNRCENTCLSLCRDSTCDKTSGNCADCQISPKGANCFEQDPVTAASQTATENLSVGSIAGITAGCVAFVILFVVVFVCCMNYKRQYDDAKTEIHLPSDVLERLSTHRSLHSSVSANYPVARVVGDDEKDFVLF